MNIIKSRAILLVFFVCFSAKLLGVSNQYYYGFGASYNYLQYHKEVIFKQENVSTSPTYFIIIKDWNIERKRKIGGQLNVGYINIFDDIFSLAAQFDLNYTNSINKQFQDAEVNASIFKPKLETVNFAIKEKLNVDLGLSVLPRIKIFPNEFIDLNFYLKLGVSAKYFSSDSSTKNIELMAGTLGYAGRFGKGVWGGFSGLGLNMYINPNSYIDLGWFSHRYFRFKQISGKYYYINNTKIIDNAVIYSRLRYSILKFTYNKQYDLFI